MEINNLIESYKKTKDEINKLESQLLRYKKEVNKILDTTNKRYIKGKRYKISKFKEQRNIMKKSNIPEDIWDKYSTVIVYDTYRISKIKT